jgi:hypothetical protein
MYLTQALWSGSPTKAFIKALKIRVRNDIMDSAVSEFLSQSARK